MCIVFFPLEIQLTYLCRFLICLAILCTVYTSHKRNASKYLAHQKGLKMYFFFHSISFTTRIIYISPLNLVFKYLHPYNTISHLCFAAKILGDKGNLN